LDLAARYLKKKATTWNNNFAKCKLFTKHTIRLTIHHPCSRNHSTCNFHQKQTLKRLLTDSFKKFNSIMYIMVYLNYLWNNRIASKAPSSHYSLSTTIQNQFLASSSIYRRVCYYLIWMCHQVNQMMMMRLLSSKQTCLTFYYKIKELLVTSTKVTNNFKYKFLTNTAQQLKPSR